ncbi:hypothetical protein [Nonlabens sp. YIK11]|uniref:hypothetical protein n=1 Tax=Nonlabens sp. YIK11 TaxID=1453349 RepID=UPI0006DD3424|nr:hypothetical protein [Nonlabens sp. YIK11]
MSENHNQDSFDKGLAFEDYVEKVLFPYNAYDLQHKTNGYEQNKERYVTNSRKPDFRFKCRLTGKEFHVEAKYRTNSFKERYEILSDTQTTTFQEIHTTEVPIYIVLGYGNTAEDPEYVSLIPYEMHREQSIPVSTAFQLQIPKAEVPSSLITTRVTTDEKVEPVAFEATEHTKKAFLSKPILSVLGLVAVIAFGTTYFFLDDESRDTPTTVAVNPETNTEVLKNTIAEYYQHLDSNDLATLHNYISPKMRNWYGVKNPSLEDVRKDIEDYRNTYPFTETKVDFEKINIVEQDNGDFYITYPMEYKVKSKVNAPYKLYDLYLTTIWDKDYKLVSAQELRR